MYREAAEEARAFPEGDPRTAQALLNLATYYFATARYNEAEHQFRLGLAAAERSHSDTDAAIGWSNLGATLAALGQFDAAQSAYEKALAIGERAYGKNSRQAANVLNNLAELERKRGRLSQAEQAARAALELTERLTGPDSAETANRLHTLALIRADQKRYSEALDLDKRALAIQRQTLGEDHPRTRATLANLGAAELALGRLDEAETLINGYLASADHGSDRPDPALAAVVNNLAQLYRQRNQLARIRADLGELRRLPPGIR